MRRGRSLRAFVVVSAAAGLLSSGVAADAPDPGKVDPLIPAQLKAQGRTNVFAMMAGQADLRGSEGITDRVTRLNHVHDVLTAQAASSQSAIAAYLGRRGARYVSFWINNSVYVYDADKALVEALAARSDVTYVRADHEIPLDLPVSARQSDAPQGIEWGVAMINADDVWAQGDRGAGVVVASVDTGVRWTHNALHNQYRGSAGDHDYNWWDPDHVFAAPTDQVGHGTHTMGTMVGDDGGANQIGVAPEAKWIAAQGCDLLFCTDFDLTSSAQFLTCPTRVDGSDPDCSKAPNVINNSWGGGGGDPWYKAYTNAWLAAGIAPIFSIGNSGPGCNTAGSPGDYRFVTGVGAVDINSVLASFSSRGPGVFRPVKPDFVAPGDGVRSSYNTGDNAYAVLSGTSMAAPHVSGMMALLISHSPGATLVDLYVATRNTAVKGLPNPPDPDTCGGKSYTVYPNYHYGHGRVDALAAVNALP